MNIKFICIQSIDFIAKYADTFSFFLFIYFIFYFYKLLQNCQHPFLVVHFWDTRATLANGLPIPLGFISAIFTPSPFFYPSFPFYSLFFFTASTEYTKHIVKKSDNKIKLSLLLPSFVISIFILFQALYLTHKHLPLFRIPFFHAYTSLKS